MSKYKWVPTEKQHRAVLSSFAKRGDAPLFMACAWALEQLAAARAQVEALKGALEGLVGETDPEVLAQMEAFLASIPHPERAATLTAVRVLRALAAQEGDNAR